MNRNGRITRAELIRALKSLPAVRKLLGLNSFHQNSAGHAAFEHTFQSIDKDDSREIDYEEFARCMINCFGGPEEGQNVASASQQGASCRDDISTLSAIAHSSVR